MEYNVYCDESCHLEHDHSNYMAIGAIWCRKELTQDINKEIYRIKEEYGYSKYMEMKWTKISESNFKFYKQIIDYFFNEDRLHFRCYIADKRYLNHSLYNQTHDDWYYKIYFRMIEFIFIHDYTYNVYLDIKDHNSFRKCQKLHEISCNNIYDFDHIKIKKVQPIRSNETQIIQLTDILIGAVCNYNRYNGKTKNIAKKEIINLIMQHTNSNLETNSYLSNRKFNLFFWSSRNE